MTRSAPVFAAATAWSLVMVPLAAGALDRDLPAQVRGPLEAPSLNASSGCAATAGHYYGDGSSAWVPTCLGVFSDRSNSLPTFATRGSTSTTNPPIVPDLTQNGRTMLLVQQELNSPALAEVGITVNQDISGGHYGSQKVGVFCSQHIHGTTAGGAWCFNTDQKWSAGTPKGVWLAWEQDMSHYNEKCSFLSADQSGCFTVGRWAQYNSEFPVQFDTLINGVENGYYLAGAGTIQGNALTATTITAVESRPYGGRLGPFTPDTAQVLVNGDPNLLVHTIARGSTVASAGTTTKITVAAGDQFLVNDYIHVIGLGPAFTDGQSRVTAISGNTLTLSPALNAVPTAGMQVQNESTVTILETPPTSGAITWRTNLVQLDQGLVMTDGATAFVLKTSAVTLNDSALWGIKLGGRHHTAIDVSSDKARKGLLLGRGQTVVWDKFTLSAANNRFQLGVDGYASNWSVDIAGVQYASGFRVTGSGRFSQPLRTPASSREACQAGDFVDDVNYHYVCVAANTWKRVALSSW